jgi:DNA-binding MarR family transcriptional regulator
MLGGMTDGESGSRYDTLGIPGLLRRARKAYGNVVSQAFADAGFDDLPRNGAYVLARVYSDSSASGDLARDLGISKQAVSQLIDTMVMRGYLARTPDTEDRRRMLLSLTPRGEAAATVSWQAATEADTELASRLSADGIAALRAGLVTLCKMADETDSAASHGEHSHHEHSHGDHSDGDLSNGEHGHGDHSI